MLFMCCLFIVLFCYVFGFFYILKALQAHDHNQKTHLKELETVLNGDANDKSRGNQTTGPVCLQRELREINWMLFPIE